MGLLVIPDGSLVYLDTSVVIYTVEQVPAYYSLLEPLWTKFQNGDIRLLSSELLLLEALVLPLRLANTTLVTNYEQLLLSSALHLIPIDQTILRTAAQLRAETSLKTPDAIHAATALGHSASLFLTNDSQFRVVSGLTVVVLSEVLTA
jgi:predicted nucleic acid-binding protein